MVRIFSFLWDWGYSLFIYLLYLTSITNHQQLCTNQNRQTPHKKRDKNVNKNVKEDNRICTVLSNKPYMLNASFTYSTWTLFTLLFSNFLFRNFERRCIFNFFSYQVPYLRSSIRDGFSPVFCSSLICRVQTLNTENSLDYIYFLS